MLNARVNVFLNTSGNISDNQAAFRKVYTTVDHIFTLKLLINKYAYHQKGKVFSCFIDFRKAFDCDMDKGESKDCLQEFQLITRALNELHGSALYRGLR